MQEVAITVLGRVQGVGFRAQVLGIAKRLFLVGEVKNNHDGSVSIVAQGERLALEEFIQEVMAGPGFSKIENMSYHFYSSSSTYSSFSIVRDSAYLSDKVVSVVRLGKQILGKGSGKPPLHIALIPDGNRRWARERGKDASFGHYSAGDYEHIKSLFEQAKNMGVKYFSVWGFSTENWKRSDAEIKAIFDLLIKSVDKFKEDARAWKIRFRHVGRKDRLPKELISALGSLEEETKGYTEFCVQLCLDYGGRDEIIRAVNKMLMEKVGKVDEESFSKWLDTVGTPDPDLIIRTSGEQRTSGLMPYQATYAELYFSEKFFPDFSASDLKEAILQFSNRVRRFGATAVEDFKKKHKHRVRKGQKLLPL